MWNPDRLGPRSRRLLMILIPSIELMEGKVVQLAGGRPEDKTVLSDDPVGVARELSKEGALFFHLVDLDAVFGTGSNDPVFQKFAEALMPFQVRGGIRTSERVEELIGIGADRVVVGKLFQRDLGQAKKLIDEFGMRVMAALDVEDGQVKANSWEDESGTDLQKACKALAKSGVGSLMYTRIDRKGEHEDPDVDGTRAVIEAAGIDVYANIGVRTPKHRKILEESSIEGLVGVVLGASYYGDKLKAALKKA